jgi:hypothetical protein
MHVAEESDHGVIPVSPSHKGGSPPAERGEGDAGAKEDVRPAICTRPSMWRKIPWKSYTMP